MKRRSLITSGLLFCAASSLTIGCGDRPDRVAPTNNPNPNGLKLGFSAWPGWFPWQVAQEKQLFQQAKIDVNLQWFDNYLDSIAALETGKVDANSQTLGDTIIFSVDDNLEAFKPGKDTTSLPKAALETSKFLFENKLIAAPVDISNIFDDRFVKAYAAKKKSA
jgi:hypothetical protein